MSAEEQQQPETRPPRQEQQPAADEITEVAPGVLRLQLPINLPGLGHVNCYALEDEHGVALIDPGLPGPNAWKALLDRLGDAGFELRHVHTTVVTHSHFDHFGAADQIRDETGADVVTHESFRWMWEEDEIGEPEDSAALELTDEEELDRLREFFRRPTPWGTSREPPPDEVIEHMRVGHSGPWFPTPTPSLRIADGDHLRLARRDWFAVHTPGHTEDHLCLFDPEHGVMVSGDHVLPTITPHISGYAETDPLARFFASLEKMTTYEDVTIALPAHGHPFTDLAGRARDILHHHEERLDLIRVAVDELGSATVTEYMQQLFKERSWGSMAESETFAHLEHLRVLGEVTVRTGDGPTVFQAA